MQHPNAAARSLRSLKSTMRRLYFGSERSASWFRLGLLAIDIALLAYFVIGSFYYDAAWHRKVDIAIATFLAVDWLVKFWVNDWRPRYFRQLGSWIDLVVITSLLMPVLAESFLFVRVLRFMRLFHSYHVVRDLRQHFDVFRRNEEVINASLNLAVFVFVMSSIVYVLQVRTNPGINNYVDALYFTVTTLTTTGFGDIVMRDTVGRLLAVAIMIAGFGLFLQLVQAIFRPRLARIVCAGCGLSRHDPDAVHCKRCGHVLKIGPEDGDA